MRVLAVNLEIGLGHPNYLDYVLQALHNQAPDIEIKHWDVISNESALAKRFWQSTKMVYRLGAQEGIFSRFYNTFRAQSKNRTFPGYVLQSTQKEVNRFPGIILISHPLLAQSICGRVWYIHGEIAAPQEAICKNVEKIIVPLNETKEKFISYGIKPDKVLVTGLLLAPELTVNAKEVFQKRLLRIRSEKPLTIGFFISGAYPKSHIDKIIAGIISATEYNQRVIVFIGIEAKKAKDFLKQLNKMQVRKHKSDASIIFLQGKDRAGYQNKIHRLLPLLDAFVAASHEHTNWAIGLGLPMFALFPMIGSYAEENFKFARKQGVVFPLRTIADAKNLGKTVLEIRSSGVLLKMIENGFGKFPIDGAIITAHAVIKSISLTNN
jgi:hypothetical protein